jgi:hypothetical protein
VKYQSPSKYHSNVFLPTGTNTGSVGENNGKLEQSGTYLSMYQQMTSTRRKEIIKDKTTVSIKLMPVQGVFAYLIKQMPWLPSSNEATT